MECFPVWIPGVVQAPGPGPSPLHHGAEQMGLGKELCTVQVVVVERPSRQVLK